jgi:hypothetical protein
MGVTDTDRSVRNLTRLAGQRILIHGLLSERWSVTTLLEHLL